MNKIYSFAFAMAMLGGSAIAQQLPNADFEGAWVDCVPWNTANTTTKQGTTPESWCISNVVTPGMAAGNATVGEKKAGNNSDNAVRVFNKSTAGQVIPGYVTLGTTWSTAKIKGMTPSNEDGGSWGGIDFAYRPDALQFDFIHEQGSGSTQPATAVVYLWKGETQQAEVPGANSYNLFSTPSNPATCTMINRDRNIFGMETIMGGAVTKSGDFEKIAATTYSITTVNSEWETVVVPIEYFSTATPQKINVIFSSSDYFAARSNHKGNDALTVDNVKLIYYSRLSALTVGGTAVEGFASDSYDYTLEVDALPAASEIAATCLGTSGSAKATVTIDEATKKATITVTNAQGADADGLSTHTYTITFTVKAPEVTLVNSKDFPGFLTVALDESADAEAVEATVTLNQYSDGTYGMYLADFGGMGAIDLPGLTLDGTALTGHVEGFELAEGSIKANIDLTGTYDGTDLILHLDVNAYEPDDIPVKVDFTTIAPEEPGLKFRRIYTDNSSRYYNNISYTVLGKDHVLYSVADPRTEDYYVAPTQNSWQTEGAYIDFTDKVINIPVNAEDFTVTLKSDANVCSSKWSQNAIFVDWNGNGEYEADETNGVINISNKPNAAGGGLVITESGDTDVITLPTGLTQGQEFNMLIAMTEPKGTDGTGDLWGSNWEWTKEIFNGNLCSLINGQAYGITVRITEPDYSAIGSIAGDASADAPVEYFTLQGVRVAADSLTPGFYVARQAGKAFKVIVK